MMHQLRIFHVSTTVQRGGAENHLFDLVQHQRRTGAHVTVAHLRGNTRDLGVPVHDLALRYYGQLAPLIKLRRLIRTVNPDLIHAHLPPAELYCRLALLGIRGRRLPLVITKHNDEPFYKGPGERLMGRWVAKRASAVIAISQAVHRYMAGPALGIASERLHTIYYGIDAQPFHDVPREAGLALRKAWGVPQDAQLIGFAGRLVPQKSLDTLLEGFALLRQQTSNDAWLALVGVGELEAPLRRQAEQRGIADRVVWPGFHEDMPSVMRAFDVFALTSVHEGFGLVLVEAMAAGLPVAATRAGAIPEIVVDGETGFVVEPRRPQELADALKKLGDSALRARMGTAGRQRVREFTLERMYRQTDELYERVLSLDCSSSRLETALTAESM